MLPLLAIAASSDVTSGLWLLGAVVLGLSGATVLAGVFYRLRLPPVLGYILTGVLIDPVLLGSASALKSIQEIAHIGVVLLLFMVGLELSPSKLQKMRGPALRVGLMQIAFSTGLIAGVLMLLWQTPLILAVLLGATLSLSSTAIVLKSLEEQQELDTAHGRLSLGTLIVQDMVVIPLLLLWPMLSLAGTTSPESQGWMAQAAQVGWGLGKALLVLVAAVVLSFKLVPRILDQLARTRSRELFTLSVVCLGLGVALLAQWAGVSMEAGAFIAGLALSGSIYSRQVLADTRPFRDVFATIFFVSVGLVLNPRWLASHLPETLGFLLVLSLLKVVGTTLAVRLSGYSWRTVGWTALTLFQMGEFAFLLLRGIAPETLPPELRTWLLAHGTALIHASVLSMFITPLVLKALPWLMFRLPKRRTAVEVTSDAPTPASEPGSTRPPLCGHTVVVGYGPMGRQVVKALQTRWQDVLIVDTNPETVKRLQAQGVPCVYGDVTQLEVQMAAHLPDARVLVLTVPDARIASEATRLARQLNPELRILARVRFAPDQERLMQAGASHAVHEELEAGLRLALLTLTNLGLSEEEAYATRLMLRDQEQANLPLRTPLQALNTLEPETILGRLTLLAGTQIEWFEVCPNTPMLGGSIPHETIRQETGANVIGLICAKTGERLNVDQTLTVALGDILIAVGTPEQLDRLEQWMEPCAVRATPSVTA